jgi:anaerobic magnesium-protoporphyrin IX monomethyl ester cyclase
MTATRARPVILISDLRGMTADEGGPYMPLATIAIGSALAAHGYRPVILDSQIEADWAARLSDLLRSDNPVFVGLTALTGPSILVPLEACAIVRRQAPEVPIVWGGYHATQAYEGLFAEGLADYVVRGAGEDAAIRLADALSLTREPGAEVLRQIPGLVWLDEGTTAQNPRVKIESVQTLPRLDYSLVDVPEYFRRGPRRLYYITSYGCPHACTFCAEPTQSLRRWRGHPAERVVDELCELSERYCPDAIGLMDPNFSTNPARIVDIVAGLESRNTVIPVVCDMRARDVIRLSALTELGRLPRVGINSVFIGVESGSDRILKIIRKGSTSADALEACRRLAHAGVAVHASFIHDFPDEQEADSDATLDLAGKLCCLPNLRQSHHFYTPYPLTELFEDMARRGLIGPVKLRAQADWAKTSTYYGSDIWSGRPSFRRRVLRKLIDLQRNYPAVIARDALPVLRLVR